MLPPAVHKKDLQGAFHHLAGYELAHAIAALKLDKEAELGRPDIDGLTDRQLKRVLAWREFFRHNFK